MCAGVLLLKVNNEIAKKVYHINAGRRERYRFKYRIGVYVYICIYVLSIDLIFILSSGYITPLVFDQECALAYVILLLHCPTTKHNIA